MKKHLNIAMYFASDPSKTGGVQEHVYYLAKELKGRGHKVTVFGSAPSARFADYQRLGHTMQIPMPNGNWISVTLPFPGEKKPSEVIKSGGFDLCHIHEPYSPFITWDLINHLTIPKVVTFHGAWDNGSFGGVPDMVLPMFKSTFSSKVDGAVFISATAQKKWKSLCSGKVKKKVIFYGIDHHSFYPSAKRHNGSVNLLFLARLVKKKGLLYLLEALLPLIAEFSRIKLTVVGEGEAKDKFTSFVRSHHLQKHVSFVGEIVGPAKAPYFRQADIFCAPYKDEGFGLTVLEAISCGVPVVGFRNEAFSEWLSYYPGKRFLVEPRNVTALTKALRELIVDQRLRQQLGNWCVERSKMYSWEKVGIETEQFYYQVLATSII